MRRLVMMVMAACAESAPVVSDGVHLSTEGLYDDVASSVVSAHAIEFAPAYALWADGAEKRRWIVLPPGTELDTSDPGDWELPVGAKLFKEFSVAGRRVETRLVERVSATEYRFEPYVWLPDESDAVIVPDGASDVLGTQHDIPGRADCAGCHDSARGKLLGVSAVQLSAMAERSLPISHPVPRIEMPAALGVLHANCGHCHTAMGQADFMQLKFSPNDAGLPIADTAVYRSIVGVPTEVFAGADYRVVPGDAEASAIVMRMASREAGVQMPPTATERPDDAGLRLVRAWINSISPER
jgi:hypothetical protein